MLVQYGHVGIEWQGENYTLSPTLSNIAKLGSPTEIIEVFKSFISESNPVWKFNTALFIINSCSDKEIPEKLTGKVKFSAKKKRFMYVKPINGLPMFDDVLTLAEHCLIHGICGKVESSGEGEPLSKFDPYKYMEVARIHLGMSAKEAGDMTMTEFARMMMAKYPEPVNENQGTKEQNDELLAWLENKNKVH